MSLAKIGNRIFDKKVELSRDEVELASLKEILLGATKGVNVFSDNIDISINELEKVKRSLKVDVTDLKNELPKLEDAVKRIETQTKNLGINPTEIGGYKEAKKAIAKGGDKLKEAKSII